MKINPAKFTKSALTLAVTVLALSGLLNSVTYAAPPFGSVKVLATVPTPPGFPEGIAVNGNKVYVAGPAKFGTTGNGQPSRALAFNIDSGALTSDYPAQGENLLAEHANSSVAFDASNRLYVLNTQLGTLRYDIASGAQSQYSPPFPDLKSCSLLQPALCSPTLLDLPSLPNDIAFDDLGNAYVTDSLQATIWRIPPGGGAPQIWFQDIRLASAYIGVNGLRIDPTRTRVFFTVTNDLLAQGYVYTLPLVAKPRASDLRVFHHYVLAEGPDGIAFGKSGKLYVATALPGQSGVSILRPDGTQQTRLKNPLLSPASPYDSPANIAFKNKSGALLITNHAFVTGNLLPGQFTILEVFVNDQASPLATPAVP